MASLARQLDNLKTGLPDDVALKGKLQNLVQTQLAPAFKRLIAYNKAGSTLGLIKDIAPKIQILRQDAASFGAVLSHGLSGDWSGGAAWAAYVAAIAPDASVYGDTTADVFTQINHCSTHTLFKSVFDQFLQVFAGVVGEANAALNETLDHDNTHEPHYALYLAFLRLFEYARTFGNKLTQRHLDFYYRTILGLKQKSGQPGHVHLLAELARQTASRHFPAGETFKAGKDDQGKDAFFANETDFVANQAKVAALKNLYRHGSEPVNGSAIHQDRMFASQAANSDDGLGAPLTSSDGSWHPFFNKIYTDGALTQIRMPEPEIGFAIASHYLLMAGGTRTITLEMAVSEYTGPHEPTGKEKFSDKRGDRRKPINFSADIQCLVTTEKGWLEVQTVFLTPIKANQFDLVLTINGDSPPIVPYVAKTHGYNFQTDQPILLVKLKQDDTRRYAYPLFQGVAVSNIEMQIEVEGLKTLAVSNDFGPLDTSKPFQPFGASPVAGSSLIVGSREIFQKKLSELTIDLEKWMVAPAVYPPTASPPNVVFDVLSAGQWTPTGDAAVSVANTEYDLSHDLNKTVQDQPDFTANTFYNTQSRNGYVRLRLTGDFGQNAYQAALIAFLRKDSTTNPGPKPPSGPLAASLSTSYTAQAKLGLNTANEQSFDNRPGRFFHLTPFGSAEQHPFLLQGAGRVFLFPQFEFERNGRYSRAKRSSISALPGWRRRKTSLFSSRWWMGQPIRWWRSPILMLTGLTCGKTSGSGLRRMTCRMEPASC